MPNPDTTATPDDFALKAVRVNHKASEETCSYTATLYFKGKKIAEIGNRGCGGCDWYHKTGNLSFEEVSRIVARTFPKCTNQFLPEGHENRIYDTTLEILCGEWVNRHIKHAEIKRITKTKILYVMPDGKSYTYKSLGKPSVMTNWVKTKHPSAVILNGMDLDEASALLYPENSQESP